MDTKRIEELRKQINNRFPLIGRGKRITACQTLVDNVSVETLPLLIEVFEGSDPDLKPMAESALRKLPDDKTVSSFCSIWMEKNRDKKLGALIRECGYVASSPVELRVFSALKSGNLDKSNDSKSCLQPLLDASKDTDPDISSNAAKAIRTIKNQELIDSLCQMVFDKPNDAPVSIMIECGYAPKDPSQRSVFFILTEQLEKYFDFDFDYKYLRAEYNAADSALKRRIQGVINKTGDVRLIDAFKPKTVKSKIGLKAKYSEQEADLVIDVFRRNQKWNDIVALMTMIPVSSVVKALDVLHKSGWTPTGEVEKTLLDGLYSYRKIVGEIPAAPPEPDVVVGPVIGKWIEEGRSAEYTGKQVGELRTQFADLDPRLAVRALSTLSHTGKLTNDDIEKARNHPNWLVRIASLVLCEIAPEFAFSSAPVKREGGELWIDKLAPAILDASQYRSYSIDLNPDNLETLQKALAGAKSLESSRKACGQIVEALARYRMRGDIDITEKISEIQQSASEMDIDIEEIL